MGRHRLGAGCVTISLRNRCVPCMALTLAVLSRMLRTDNLRMRVAINNM
jgi:hypothetical protein